MRTGSPWRVAGASIAGPGHEADGGACQDAHRVHVTREGWLIAVVSDGAGSATYGGEGAGLVCDAVVDGLDGYFALPRRGSGRAALLGLCRAVRDAVIRARTIAQRAGAEHDVPLSAFHATLVGAAMLPGKGGLFFHIGDGAALALAQDDGRWLLSAPRNGEYANTTYFFTQQDWRRHLRFKTIDAGFDTIFVMSDGVTELGLNNQREPHMPFFEPIGRFLAGASREEGEQALTATLDSGPVRQRTADDKTLVWAQAAR